MNKLTKAERELMRKLGSAGGKKAAAGMTEARKKWRAKKAAKASVKARKKK